MDKRHLLEEDHQRQALKEFNNLQSMKELVDWELFRPLLEDVFGPPRTRGPGRRPWDSLLLLRSLLLGVMNSLSDEQLQYMLLDRTSFKPFAGLHSKDQVPDQKTLWMYRNMLSPSGRSDELVALFKEPLAAHGSRLQTGTLVDSSVVQVLRQRNSREENAVIKSGEVPSDWKEQPHKLCPKDTEARWFKKKGVTHFGYKNHIAVDRATKLITNWEVSPAHGHDSQVFEVLLDAYPPKGHEVSADRAYRSEERLSGLRKKEFKPRITHKARRGQPLSSRQIALNHSYSKVRCRVEHVFGAMRNDRKVRSMTCLGLNRSRVWIGLGNLCYTIKRLSYLQRAAVAL